MAKENQKSVVITGCDTPNSYGYEFALCLDKQGYVVFAGCSDCNSIGARSLASRGSTQLAVLQLDVTKQDEIEDAVEMVQDAVGEEGVWALVNCAESYCVGEVDWMAVDDYEQMMDINFLGTVRVVKALLPLLRKAKGRIVNLSNLSGCIARGGLSSFSATKFALEAFSDSLRREMSKWGIFVSIIQPAFLPDSKSLLVDPQTSVRLKRISQELKEVYGEDYFSKYIHSLIGSLTETEQLEDCSVQNTVKSDTPASTLSSGYSSMTFEESSSFRNENSNSVNLKNRSKVSPSTLTEDQISKISETPTFSNVSRTQTPAKLSNINKGLHALMDSVTSPSPKVRYFVGSFQDYVIKSVSPMLPTNFIDYYFTSGQIAKVVPLRLKPKQD